MENYMWILWLINWSDVRAQLKCDDAHAENSFRLSAKKTNPFKSAGASVQSTTGSRGVRISDSNAGYTMFRGSVKGTGYPFHSPVSPSLPLPRVTVCHHISPGVFHLANVFKFIPALETDDNPLATTSRDVITVRSWIDGEHIRFLGH